MSKIVELTKKQEEEMFVYRDIYMDIGLACGPTNREAVIPAFKALYTKILNKPEPKYFLFVRSPIEAQKVITFLLEDPTDAHKKWTLENNDELIKTLQTEKMNHIQTHSYGYGSNESYWIGFYNYMRDVLGVQYPELANEGLNIFNTITRNSGWHYLAEDCVIICDRPTEINLENGNLHNEEGPSISFADGFKMFHINGHKVTEKIVLNPEMITVDEIKKESNNETKRIMIEKFGVSEYLTQTSARILDKDKLNLEGSATRLLIEDDQNIRWLCCTDGSTGRMYFLPASENSNTCSEAHQEMAGFNETRIIAEC